MKRSVLFFPIMAGISLIISACNLPFGAVATEPPVALITESPATAVVVTEPPAVVTDIPTATEAALVTINLAGPPMELGSKYKYVDGSILIAVPGGEFIMGYNASDNPIHNVTLSDFWIYSTKVTNQQYTLCVQAGKCTPPDPLNNPDFEDHRFGNFPVTAVNHTQAAEYCSYVHGRLPSEAEWEKTARGPEGNLFPWGDEAPVCDLLNFKFCEGKTTAVNDYTNGISYYGAFDMSGNAREWVADWYSPTYYSEAPVVDPLGPTLGEKRSVRGSSFQDSADPSISAHRFSLVPTENLNDLGFRCVVEDPTYFAPMCEQLGYIGTGPLGEPANCTPDIRCNDVNISQAPNCTGKPYYIPYTIVTFSLSDTPPDAWTYDVPGCSSPVAGELNKFQCDLPGPYTASAEGSCVDMTSCVSDCPANYARVKDTCVWDGSKTGGTACFGSATYDPLNSCCSAAPDSVLSFELCPPGFYRFGDACVIFAGVIDSELQAVLFDTQNCHPPVRTTPKPNDDPGGGCSTPPQVCGGPNNPYLAWDSTLCCCAYTSPTAGSFCVNTP